MASRRPFPLAYPCPACRSPETALAKTERDDAFLVRIRHCRACGADFETYEIPAAAGETLMARARRAGERKAA